MRDHVDYENYVRMMPDEILIRDLERDIVPARQVAIALVRERAARRQIAHELAERADHLDQLLGLIHVGGERTIVVPIPDGPAVRIVEGVES